MLRTFESKNFEKLRTAQPEPKFTGSYKKKRVRDNFTGLSNILSVMPKKKMKNCFLKQDFFPLLSAQTGLTLLSFYPA